MRLKSIILLFAAIRNCGHNLGTVEARSIDADPIDQSDNDFQTTTAVIDILSQNVEFGTFLRVIQRKGLVPILNTLENYTLIAPVNSAFAKVDTLPDNFERYIIENEVLRADEYEDTGSVIFRSMDDSPTMLNWDPEFRHWLFDDSEIVDSGFYANQQNAVVYGVDSLLQSRKSTSEWLCTNSPLANHTMKGTFDQFKSFVQSPDSRMCKENSALSNMTGFIPLDSSENFNDAELNYLLHTSYGETDRNNYIDHHWTWGMVGGNVTLVSHDLAGNKLSLRTDSTGSLAVNGTYNSKITNFLTSDGILHFFETDMESVIDFTARKYLHGLNATSFVKELDFRDLSYLIDDNELSQTIFLNVEENDDQSSFSVANVHKNNDLYQFAQGNVELAGDVLLKSKLCFNKIGNNCQRIKVKQKRDGQYLLNDHIHLDASDRYEVGNTTIFLTKENLAPPSRLDLAVGPFYHTSRTVRYMNNLDLLNLANNNKGYTIFVPENDAWEDLELTWKYLQKNHTAMSTLLRGYIVDGLVYSDFEGTMNSVTATGSHVTIEKKGTQLTFDGYELEIEKSSDILFSQGVAHTINEVVFPPDLQITLEGLVDSVDSKLFKEFLKAGNLLSTIEEQGYSLILPSESSLQKENITLDYTKMQELLGLHLIPQTSLDALLSCESKIPVALNHTDLSCRELTRGHFMLQILEGNDKEVRVINKGCTSNNRSTKQCLFLVDRPINPDWRDKPFMGIPHIKLPFVAMGVGAIISIFVVMVVLSCCIFVFIGKNQTEAYREDTLSDEDEESRLLSTAHSYGAAEEQSNNVPTSNNHIDEFSEANYSDNAQSRTIDVRNKSTTSLNSKAQNKKHANFW